MEAYNLYSYTNKNGRREHVIRLNDVPAPEKSRVVFAGDFSDCKRIRVAIVTDIKKCKFASTHLVDLQTVFN